MSASDSAALARAASAAEEALQLEREALAVLLDGWTGESASAAADFLDSHCQAGEALVAALRHASAVLGSQDEAATPQSAAAPPAPMSWPSVPLPAMPDFGGAIGNLLASAIDAFTGDDAAVADAADATPAREPIAGAKPPASPVPAPAVVPDPVAPPVAPPAQSAPLLAAELPPPAADPVAAQDPAADRTPCEIAADELPQVGE